MSSFVFNDFKRRYLNGEVPSADNWTFIPVNDTFKTEFEFKNIRLDHYRSLSDFRDVSNSRNSSALFTYTGTEQNNGKGKADFVNISGSDFRLNGSTLYQGVPITYKWTKVIDDEEFNNKPIFVTMENYENFTSFYSASISGNAYINDYLNRGGFYYIRSKDELEWFADRSNYNNTIIGVIGDNLEGVINKPIGANEDKPFNGILDGNYYTFDISIKAQGTDNGVVGVLGPFGVVRNVVLKNTKNVNNINCEKTISLTHIRNDGRDINCGLLVGRNYGLVENINANELNNFNIFGCIPNVYSVTNKSDNYKWNDTEKIVRDKFDNNNENFMYLNSFCINSPGNICPYVGYFNEGKFADDACALATDTNVTSFQKWYYFKNGHYTDANGNVLPEGAKPVEVPVSYCGDTSTQKEEWATNFYNYFANWGQWWLDNYGENNIDLSFRVTTGTNSLAVNYYPLGNLYGYGDSRGVEFGRTSTTFYKPFPHDDLVTSSLYTNKALQTYIYNPLYYGLDNFGYYTVRGVGNLNRPTLDLNGKAVVVGDLTASTSSWIENYNSNLCQKALGTAYKLNSNLAPGYEATRCSLRLHPQARAAYNVGIIIGANYGTANNIEISAVVKNTSNFVGFIGGLAGKHAYGEVNNVSVYMDNELVYDFGTNIEFGDVVYYKQTPIFPNCVKEYINSVVPDDNVWKKPLVNLYCKPWYDNQREDAAELPKTCNTAETVTDDVVSYKLRPIFVVGGLFGRYIPTYGIDLNNKKMKSYINNATVLYKDNYYATVDTSVKRAENAFGAIIGKVDYSTNSNNIYIESAMACNNCRFSAITPVGEPYQVYGNFLNTEGDWEPLTIDCGDGTSALTGNISYNHYVGIYELKYNTIDTVSYAVNGASTASVDKSINFPKTKKSLFDVGIYWGFDYPIDLSSHYGGIEQSHNMFGFVNPNWPDLTWKDSKGNIQGPWDITHKYYNFPNYNSASQDGGINKRNMATMLITFNDCYSNIDNWIQLYDDYMNNWNYMKLPKQYIGLTSFNAEQLYVIRKYWSRNRTMYRGYTNNASALSAELNWSPVSANLFANTSALFIEGLLPFQVNGHLLNGTQNTFDGYTTVNYKHHGWYNGKTIITGTIPYNSATISPPFDCMWQPNPSVASAYERNVWLQMNNIYLNPRDFQKNILTHYNIMWNVYYGEEISINPILPSSFPHREGKDEYYYYTYDTKSGENNTIHKSWTTLNNAFAFTLPITFTAADNYFGYSTPMTPDEQEQNINYITIGQYYLPSAIRNHINNSTLYDENGYKYFTTTSVSSNENFGGLLVVDSSGRNVMFMDNENNMPITGNTVAFGTVGLNNINKVKDNKLILSV